MALDSWWEEIMNRIRSGVRDGGDGVSCRVPDHVACCRMSAIRL